MSYNVISIIIDSDRLFLSAAVNGTTRKSLAFRYCTILQRRTIKRIMYYLVEAMTMNLS